MNLRPQIVALWVFVSPLLAGPATSHWAFQPLTESNARASIDGLVSAELAKRGASMAPPAESRVLIRRLTHGLTGLPPTFYEVREFVASAEDSDRSDSLVEFAVERLLASPRFGEKWARHWLDVARYADTKGYVFQQERRFPYSYGYRDWVIRALNEDMPYDQFVVAQLAADSLGEDRKGDLAAMGFLTLGRRFLNREPDIIDDRIDVVTRGLLGLTVSCARCHDHKFDPIPTEDYYSLYGVFSSSMEPAELPLVGAAEDSADYVQFKKRLAGLEAEVDDFRVARHAELFEEETVAKYLSALWDSRDGLKNLRRFASDRKLYPEALSSWREMYRGDGAAAFDDWRGKSEAAKDAEALAVVHREFAKELVDAAARESSNNLLTEVLSGVSAKSLIGDYNVKDRNEHRRRERSVAKFKATGDGAPTRAMVLVDRESLVEPVVFERGNPSPRGAKVARQLLSLLSEGARQPFARGSGRRGLAEAIVTDAQPLTARVMANRIWMHLMGVSLVATPSDFGVRTPEPAVPGLLDHLAATFVESGWSVKALVRHIVLSKTYQRASQANRIGPSNQPIRKIDSSVGLSVSALGSKGCVIRSFMSAAA